ncbi:MAG: phosphoribosylamine--glycine ligase [Gammaproteobacteria bacterium]|nr:phosphoribosylamine--glycine ligase [Gammaproteobacteria bacterium]
MKVLIIGGGGREHALAWKTAQSPRVNQVFVAPGNAGTAREPKCENVAVAADDVDGLLRFARDRKVDLTLVGPEAPLVLGVVDRFQAEGLRCFGPTQAAARLEGSKAYAKDFAACHHIPSPAYASFTDPDQAVAYIEKMPTPLVVKADGLAAGKGVIIARTRDEARRAVTDMLLDRSFGEAGRRVVIEEFISGEEASFIVMVDGTHVLPLATSQDHKRLHDGDQGPNTGGMGAYSPAPVVTPELHARILREVIEPTVRGMSAEGHPYAGFLYAGLMITPDGTPKLLEYNCRFGDPETQPILLRLQSDLVELVTAALEGRLDRVTARWDARAALGVVLAAAGYPGVYRKGDVINGLPQREQPGAKVFHAGTAQQDGQVVTAGGRVLCACALGDTIIEARRRAYDLARHIHWEGVQYRSDIGQRAVARETQRVPKYS